MKTKILYVEDEPFLAKIVRETLELKDFEVKHIMNGSNAIKAFQQFKPDICVLDVMLPGMDGFSIGSEIRALDDEIPILFLTAKDQTKDLLKGFSSGGNDYVKKPFSIEELIARIENLLDLTAKAESRFTQVDDYKIGSFNFSPVQMKLVNGDSSLNLSHRESEILNLLCKYKNGSVERKKILMEVWGDDSFFNSRNLDVYIRKIRKYLSSDPSVQLITLKGIGYRLVDEN